MTIKHFNWLTVPDEQSFYPKVESTDNKDKQTIFVVTSLTRVCQLEWGCFGRQTNVDWKTNRYVSSTITSIHWRNNSISEIFQTSFTISFKARNNQLNFLTGGQDIIWHGIKKKKNNFVKSILIITYSVSLWRKIFLKTYIT